MCRHLAYLGPAVTLSELLLDSPHSLLRQTWAPSDMCGGGSVNADGFGVGWVPDTGGPPVVYRRACPMWADASLPGLAGTIRSTAVLAAARNGTVGLPVVETACAPFTDGQWLFSHNGLVTGWPGSVGELAARLPVLDLMTLDAPTDSALLWALVRHRLRAGDSAGSALATVTAEVAAAAPGSRLNLLLTDGSVLAATTWTHSLWTRRAAGALAVSSEPWDDGDAWQAVPDGHVVTGDRRRLDLHPIKPMEG
ncbi:MAG: ergothioneine biosynthesis protein EgtC [Propionibacteriales bacterium]|nr:ergothioneine biosynthesis protein EgtC [Propionibacteriales bacterium]